MSEDSKIFLKFHKHEDDPIFTRFRVDNSFEALGDWPPKKSENDAVSASPRLTGDGEGVDFEELMNRFSTAMSSYFILLPGMQMILGSLVSVAIDKELYGFAKANGELLAQCERSETYGLGGDKYGGLSTRIDQVERFNFGANQLERMILAGVVASFDAHMAGLLRLIFDARPELLRSSGVSLSSEDAFSTNDVNDLRRAIKERKIESIMHGSHFDLIKYIDESLGNEMRSKYERFADFIEIFERRNVFMHAEGFVTRLYIDKCKAASYVVPESEYGRRLECDRRYLNKSIDTMMDAGLRLIAVCWHKLRKDEVQQIAVACNEVAFKLLKNKNYRSAAWFLTGILERFGKACEPATRLNLTLNLANAYKCMGDDEKLSAALGREQWDTSSEKYKICAAAVRGDVDAVLAKLPIVKMTGEISLEDIIEWPVFNHVRGDDRFVTAVREQFGGDPTRKMFDRDVDVLVDRSGEAVEEGQAAAE